MLDRPASLRPRDAMISVLVTWLCVLFLCVPLNAPAQSSQSASSLPHAPDSSTSSEGTGSSYWGFIAPATDSTSVVFTNRGRKAWEWPLAIPYAVINLPLRYLRMGLGAGIGWLDSRDFFRYLSLVPTPRGFVPGIDYSNIQGLAFTLKYHYPLGSLDNPMQLRATYSTEQWQKYTIGAIFNRNGRTAVQLGGGYRLRPAYRFYGIGPDSELENEAFYTDERAWAGGSVSHRVLSNTFVGVLGAFSSVVARDPRQGNGPGVGEEFTDVPPGFYQQSRGVMLRLASLYNSALNHGNPGSGTFVGGTVGGFLSTGDDDLEFMAYRFEFQQFIPLWHEGRALGVRAYVNWIDKHSGEVVPFQRMFTNEMPDQFRGFDSSRWRDLGITGATVEYRFPLLADRSGGSFGIDTVLLADVGQVFGEFDEIRKDNLTKSYGFGFRTYLSSNFLGAMEFVWSDEGFQFRLSTKQLFQFSREVFYLGREETLIH